MTQPVVRPLLLPAVADPLPEDAVLVAQPVAHRRELQCRHGIEEAGGQPAEPAVAQSRVRLLVQDLDPLAAALVERLLDQGIEHEIHDVVGERAANQKLDRNIVDPLRILPRVGLVRPQPAFGQNVSHRAGGRFVALPFVGGL